jgi:hypothetical protein
MSFVLLGILNSQAAGGGGVDSDFDLLETVISESNGAVSLSNLSTYAGTYQHLQLRIESKQADYSDFCHLRVNGVSSSGSYWWNMLRGTGSAVQAGSVDGPVQNSKIYIGFNPGPTGDDWGVQVVDILDAFNTSTRKNIRTYGGVASGFLVASNGYLDNNDAISSLTVQGGTALLTGTRVSLYGWKVA